MTTSEACRLIVNLTRQLAASNGERDAARAERDAYREIVGVALAQLYEKTGQLERECAARYRLVEEFRALREKGQNKPPA